MITKRQISTIGIIFLTILLLSSFAVGNASAAKPPPLKVYLTSITLDPEDATGQTTNAPGAWSTNTADPLSQVGVWKGGFLNQPINGQPGTLGEISIQLKSGINTFTLYGNRVFPSNLYYGAVLFFDGRQVGPQIAVYNQNGGTGSFMVQAAGTTIIGSANGGVFFDQAPGSSVYTAPDGTKVAVKSFTINSVSSTTDRISDYSIGADGNPDTVATLQLNVTPPQ
jgi:hypothetical protein